MEKNNVFDYYAYQNEYRKRHPEKVLQFRINAAINLLVRNGYTVTAPQEKAVSE